jgi:ABC-type nitrate/sulfonate/bicarbonate transport system substrate-binding protein
MAGMTPMCRAGTLQATGLSRRKFLGVLGVAGAATLLPLWTRRAGAAGEEPVRIGVRAASFSSWPVELAAAGGLFKDAGLPVEIATFADESDVARALAEGKVDAGVLPVPLFYAVHLGAGEFAGKGAALFTYQVSLVNGSTVVVPRGSAVRYSRQFEGSTFGITTHLGMQALLVDIYLMQSGLVPGQDVVWEVAGRDALRRKFLAGAVQALAVEEWLPAELVGAGEARVMVPLRKLWNEYPSDFIAVRKEFADRRADALERLAGATLRAARELERGSYGALKAAHPPGSGKPAAWQAGMEASGAGFGPFPYLSAARVVLEELKKRKEAPPEVDFKAVAEATCLTTFCREKMKEAGFDAVPAEDSREERMIGCCYTSF